MKDKDELRQIAEELYRRRSDYLQHAEPIIREMTKLKMLFSSPRLVIDVMDMTIHEEWISPHAADLYRKYEELLRILQDQYMDPIGDVIHARESMLGEAR